MEIEQLKNEVKKVQGAYTALQSDFDKCSAESAEMRNENISLRNENKILENKIIIRKNVANELHNEIQKLLETKQDLCKEIHKMEKNTIGDVPAQAEVIMLEEKVIHLQNELDNANAVKTQYITENTELKVCITNANNEAKEKIETIEVLKKQIPQATKEIDGLRKSVTHLNDELQQTKQDTNALSATSEKNDALTAENNKLKLQLINALQENEFLGNQAPENKDHLQVLHDNLRASTIQVEQLEALKKENSTKIAQLDAKLKEVKYKLKMAIEDSNNLDAQNNSLENQLEKLDLEQNVLVKSYREITVKLLGALEEKMQLEKEFKAIIDTAHKGSTIEDLKLALKTCAITTRNALEIINNRYEKFIKVEVSIGNAVGEID